MEPNSKINLRILREGEPTVCDSIERGTMTFGSLFKNYPFPFITGEKLARSHRTKTASFPVMFINEHTFIGTGEIEDFIRENLPIEDFVSGKSLIVQMRYRVPLFERPAFYGKSAPPMSNLSEHVSLTAELGVPENYWDDFD